MSVALEPPETIEGPAADSATTAFSGLEIGLIAVLAALLAMYSRYLNPRRPGVTTPEGFYGFYDQSQYLALARRLADLDLPASAQEYTYGLGYPAIGAFFERLGFSGDPFAPVDTALFAFVVAATAVVGARLVSRSVGLVSAVLVAVATPTLELMSLPWNSSLVSACLLVALLLATDTKPVSAVGALIGGLAVGIAFAARYPDALAVGAIVAVALLRAGPSRLRMIALSVGACLLIVGPVLWTHHTVLGSWTTTPYASHLRPDGVSDQSLGQYKLERVPRHFVEVFITAMSQGAREPRDPLLLRSPFFVLMPLGVWYLARGRHRIVVIVAFVTSAAFTTFYLSFVAGGGGDIKFGNFRYFVAWFPLWTIAAVTGGWKAVSWASGALRTSPRLIERPKDSRSAGHGDDITAEPASHSPIRPQPASRIRPLGC